jgi:hypothetical protein
MLMGIRFRQVSNRVILPAPVPGTAEGRFPMSPRMMSFAALLGACALALAVPAAADEGMFPLDGVDGWPVAEMQQAGLAVSADDVLALRRAVAKVASGGSGSFVSPEGLLVTNHHVAYRCLAALDGMDAHRGIMERGFTAADRGAEIPCPGYDLLVVEAVEDVTEQLRAAVDPKLKGHQRFLAMRRAEDELETRCQERGTGLRCEAESLDGGRAWHLAVYRLIRDVRLVYAPEKDIGKYGGDVDNWRYPRHTGDYTFLRAYVSAAGEGAPHSGDNVPFRPAAHLQVSEDGVGRDDLVLVLGFPARTRRNYPAASARFALETDMPVRADLFRGLLTVLAEAGKGDERTARRYQGLDAGLNNAVKYYGDSIRGFEQWKILERRLERDREVAARVAADDALKRSHGRVLPGIERVYRDYEAVYPKHLMLQRLAWIARSVGVAFDIVRWNEERVKPDAERKDDAYKTRNMYKVIDRSDNLDDQLTVLGEKALLGHVLREAAKLPPQARIRAADRLLAWGRKEARAVGKEARAAGRTYEDTYRELTGNPPSDDAVATALDLAYARTALLARSDDPEERDRAKFQRRRLFYHDEKEARRFRDPLLDFARGIAAELKKIEDGPYRAVEETFDTELRPAYATLLQPRYPDANFQVRLSFGTVRDYHATEDGKTHRYLTDLAGVLAKETGEDPFRVPAKLKAAAAGDKGRFVDAAIGDVPVNFTCTLDTTGGNSGSAVLDAKGRLVGLLFDGTPESILSDWQFLQEEQRSIVMDIRYALFLADKVHGAGALLKELGLSR